MTSDDRMQQEAIDWAVRTGDPSFDDWDGFTVWLEADPRHAQAYDAVSAAIADVAAGGLSPAAENDFEPLETTHLSRRRWFAAAASVVLVASFAYVGLRGQEYTVATQAGETRTIALADGSEVVLGGDSEIRLARDGARTATLARGQALFTVRHDEQDPFVVHAGGQELVDAGTVFNVSLSQGSTTVAVSEGAVVANPDGKAQRVTPGQSLTVSPSGDYRMQSVATDQVGEWRMGRLTFDDASLAFVASELTRGTGVVFEAAPSVAAQRISGSILLDPVRHEPGSLGDLLGVRVRRDGSRWIIDRP